MWHGKESRPLPYPNQKAEFDRERLIHVARVVFEFVEFDLWEEGEIEKAVDILIDAQGERDTARGDDELDLDRTTNDRWRVNLVRSVILYERGCKVIRHPLGYMDDHWLRPVWEVDQMNLFKELLRDGKASRAEELIYDQTTEWYKAVLEAHKRAGDWRLGEKWYPKLEELHASRAQEALLHREELDEPVFDDDESRYLITSDSPYGAVGTSVRLRPEPVWEFESSRAHRSRWHFEFEAVPIEDDEGIKLRRQNLTNHGDK